MLNLLLIGILPMRRFVSHLCIALVVVLPLASAAQKKKINSGIFAYSTGKYDVAINELSVGLNTPEDAKPNVIAKGYVNLAQAYTQVYNQLTNEQLAALNQYPDFKGKQNELPWLAHEAYQKAVGLGADKEFVNELAEVRSTLWFALYAESDAFVQREDLPGALRYLETAQTYKDGGNYFIQLTIGHHHLSLADTLKALEDWELGIEMFHKDTAAIRQQGEKGLRQYYQNLGILYRSFESTPEGIYAIATGSSVLFSEPLRAKLAAHGVQGLSGTATSYADQKSANAGIDTLLTKAFEAVRLDLGLRILKKGLNKYPDDEGLFNELANVMVLPQYRAEGEKFFEERITKNPGDIRSLTAYAQMFVETDPAKAETYYTKALSLDPADLFANYYMAVIRVNRAADTQKQYIDLEAKKLNTTAWEDELRALNDKTLAFMKEASEYGEKAYAANPQACAIIQLLLNTYGVLNEEAKFNAYTQIYRDTCGG